MSAARIIEAGKSVGSHAAIDAARLPVEPTLKRRRLSDVVVKGGITLTGIALAGVLLTGCRGTGTDNGSSNQGNPSKGDNKGTSVYKGDYGKDLANCINDATRNEPKTTTTTATPDPKAYPDPTILEKCKVKLLNQPHS